MQMLYALVVLLEAAAAASVASQASPGCPSSCGLVKDIFYPFGIGEACHREGFQLQCNNTFDPPRLFFDDYEIIEMLPLQGQLRSNISIARDCYDEQGVPLNTGVRSANLERTPLSFSADRNRFVVTGCDTMVYMSDLDNFGFSTGCVSVCSNLTKLQNHSCSGMGCCQTDIPVGLKYFQADFRTFNNHTRVWSFNPCSYALLVEENAFDFTTEFLAADYTYERIKWPVVLDWSVEGETDCEVAKRNASSYACLSKNSECVPSKNGLGYLCNCSDGYQGNAYLVDECHDVNECDYPEIYPCHGICANTVGGYNCTCKPGYQSDEPETKNCTAIPSTGVSSRISLPLKLVIGIGSGLFFLVLVSFATYLRIQNRKLIELKQKYFEQNGGLFLQQQISSLQGTTFKIFTMIELERATDNFDRERILGKGANGTVFRGILDDKREVAVKKSMMIDESKTKEFAREMLILSQINHKNVVKLLGCCLEVEVPMLVYECIPNGTLFQYIHENRLRLVITLDTRLRIAMEVAEALAYLHSAASPPILHGDVKSSNILLDADYVAKVSDFGTSVLAPNDKAHFTTLVQGTCGYLDPEYLQSCQLTEKSDVYSFGVVLLELLTGRKALYFGDADANRSLTQHFISCMCENRLLEILDTQITSEGLTAQLQNISELAMHCLSLKGAQRPTMKEILMELEALSKSRTRPWVQHDVEEVENLLGEPSTYQSSDANEYLSLGTQQTVDIDLGR